MGRLHSLCYGARSFAVSGGKGFKTYSWLSTMVLKSIRRRMKGFDGHVHRVDGPQLRHSAVEDGAQVEAVSPVTGLLEFVVQRGVEHAELRLVVRTV